VPTKLISSIPKSEALPLAKNRFAEENNFFRNKDMSK